MLDICECRTAKKYYTKKAAGRPGSGDARAKPKAQSEPSPVNKKEKVPANKKEKVRKPSKNKAR